MPASSKAVSTAWLAVALLLAWGCQPKPKAPALLDGPVFQSDEGFRFLAPEGWTMSVRAIVPPGPVEKERSLVQYGHSNGEGQGLFDVSLVDLPEDTDLADYLSKPSFSAREWKPTGMAESVEAGGQRGTRYRFSGSINGKESAKEVTAFRRGSRVYFFTVLFSPSDATAVEQVRRSISRLEWTK